MSEKPPISKEAARLFRFIVEHIEEYGYQPSRSEMSAKFGVSINAINSRLATLVRHGVVRLTRRERGIFIPGLRFPREHVKQEEADKRTYPVEDEQSGEIEDA